MLEITCISCGKSVPHRGELCPYCGKDKDASKEASWNFNFGAIVGFLIGWPSTQNFFSGLVIGLLSGILAREAKNYLPLQAYKIVKLIVGGLIISVIGLFLLLVLTKIVIK